MLVNIYIDFAVYLLKIYESCIKVIFSNQNVFNNLINITDVKHKYG